MRPAERANKVNKGITAWRPGDANKAARIAFEKLIERRGGVGAADKKTPLSRCAS